MAGKDGGEEIVKQGLMIKRSQNKKRFTPINYKQRWFVLTRKHLIYYDTEGEFPKTDCQVPSNRETKWKFQYNLTTMRTNFILDTHLTLPVEEQLSLGQNRSIKNL